MHDFVLVHVRVCFMGCTCVPVLYSLCAYVCRCNVLCVSGGVPIYADPKVELLFCMYVLKSVCACMCVFERENVCVSVCVRVYLREKVCVGGGGVGGWGGDENVHPTLHVL